VDAALLLLGITAPDPARAELGENRALLLEPWAVQAALRRKRDGQRLTDKERDASGAAHAIRTVCAGHAGPTAAKDDALYEGSERQSSRSSARATSRISL
jgi:hypothetical protein